jgi:hypothetical protein
MHAPFYRLSAVLHVLYRAIDRALHGTPTTDEESADDSTSTNVISEETVHMAIHLTHYFQAQRSVYEEVSTSFLRMVIVI